MNICSRIKRDNSFRKTYIGSIRVKVTKCVISDLIKIIILLLDQSPDFKKYIGCCMFINSVYKKNKEI